MEIKEIKKELPPLKYMVTIKCPKCGERIDFQDEKIVKKYKKFECCGKTLLEIK